jgi:hypothetical protein
LIRFWCFNYQAINYAKTVPKPKLMESRQHKEQDQQDDNEKEVTLLELLKMRHDKEKSEVESLRKEMTVKMQN